MFKLYSDFSIFLILRSLLYKRIVIFYAWITCTKFFVIWKVAKTNPKNIDHLKRWYIIMVFSPYTVCSDLTGYTLCHLYVGHHHGLWAEESQKPIWGNQLADKCNKGVWLEVSKSNWMKKEIYRANSCKIARSALNIYQILHFCSSYLVILFMHFCTLSCKKGSAFTSIICSLEACLAEQALANARSVEHAFGNASFLSVSTVLLHVTELAHLFSIHILWCVYFQSECEAADWKYKKIIRPYKPCKLNINTII